MVKKSELYIYFFFFEILQLWNIVIKTTLDNSSSFNIKSTIQKLEFLLSPAFSILDFYKAIARIEKYRFQFGITFLWMFM